MADDEVLLTAEEFGHHDLWNSRRPKSEAEVR
jgi:hypothetical protein